MAKLTTLKPRLQTIRGQLSALPAPAGTVERKRGSAGVRDRDRIRKRDCGLCQNCDHLGSVVDHKKPLWTGGSDEDDNKWVLCPVCHDAKSKVEAAQRAASSYDQHAVREVLRQVGEQRRRL